MTENPIAPAKRPQGFPPTVLVLLGIGSVSSPPPSRRGSSTPWSWRDGLFEDLSGRARAAPALAPEAERVRPREYGFAVAFGLVLAGMNLSLYLAIDRIPLGVAVTLEFVGPLGVAVLGSRRLLDGLWAALAAVGIVLLAPLNVLGNSDLDPVGVTFALLAGRLWACYILLTARVGSLFPGGAGLAISLAVGTVVLLPVGMADAGYALLDPWFLLAGLGVALLSSVVPYSLEMQALRRLPTRVFGVLMSLEPAVATLIGFAVLNEVLDLRDIAAVVMVTAAAAGASLFASQGASG